MKGIKFSHERRFDERIPSTTFNDANINVEFNMPISHIKSRCEKENLEEENDFRVINMNFNNLSQQQDKKN